MWYSEALKRAPSSGIRKQSLQGFRLCTNSVQLLNESVYDLQQQFDPQEVAQTCAKPADSASASQIFKRVDESDKFGLLPCASCGVDHRIELRAARGTQGGLRGLKCESQRYLLTVKELHTVLERGRGLVGDIQHSTQLGGDVNRENLLCSSGKDLLIGAGECGW